MLSNLLFPKLLRRLASFITPILLLSKQSVRHGNKLVQGCKTSEESLHSLYSCLRISMDKGPWPAIAYGVTQSQMT